MPSSSGPSSDRSSGVLAEVDHPLPYGCVTAGRVLTWSPLGKDISLSTWHRLLLFSRLAIGRRPDSAIATPRLVVPRYGWFCSFWSSSSDGHGTGRDYCLTGPGYFTLGQMEYFGMVNRGRSSERRKMMVASMMICTSSR